MWNPASRFLLTLALITALSSFSPPGAAGDESHAAPAETVDNTFPLNLYRTLAAGNTDNLFFSPYSITTALSMTLCGASGTTAEQIAGALHAPEDRKAYHAGRKAFEKHLEDISSGKTVTLETSNDLWPLKGYPFSKAFLLELERFYGAGVTPLDYRTDTEKARKTINRRVEEKTAGNIRELLPPGVLDPQTRMVLTNAVCFKGNWARRFDTSLTSDEPFFTARGNTLSVAMMRLEKTFAHAATDSMQMLELPYSGGNLSMLVLLPEKRDGLEALEKRLSPDRLRSWKRALTEKKVRVLLPKFSLSSTLRLDETLKALGVEDALDPGKADFSAMTDGNDRLFISAAIHKAWMEVNEQGTEAAAATGIVAGVTSARPEPVPLFRADHPFMVIIEEKSTGSILFMARVSDPGQS